MPSAKSLKIMVVDDQQTMRGLARQCLKRMGITDVSLAAGGEAALQQLQTSKYDVIISDLNMPGMDGMELAEKVKAHPVLKQIPFLLATSEMFRDKAEGDTVDAFVAKPFSIADLRSAMEAKIGPIS
ncbi:MAG: response regulator [Neomegalonema sp.]|nr:response regulator [Neomegalonema sp.]